jgi:hypothetical protein
MTSCIFVVCGLLGFYFHGAYLTDTFSKTLPDTYYCFPTVFMHNFILESDLNMLVSAQLYYTKT